MSINYIGTPGMTPSGSTYVDGSPAFQSPSITFTMGGTATYDTDSWNLDEDVSRKEQTDGKGVPQRAFALPMTPNGSCNVIIPSESSQLPQPGWKFTSA